MTIEGAWNPDRAADSQESLRAVIERVDIRLAGLRDDLAVAVAALAAAHGRSDPRASPLELAELRLSAVALMDATEGLCRRAAAYLALSLAGAEQQAGGLSVTHIEQLRWLYLDGAKHIARVKDALPHPPEADPPARSAELMTTELLRRLRC